MMLSISISLPNNFRIQDFFEFHRRDTLGISERVTNTTFEKGILWSGLPACIRINFEHDAVIAALLLDGDIATDDKARFESLVIHMLGLNQSITQFEAAFKSHPQIGKLIIEQSGLRVPQAATLFEALTWAIIGQQISLNAAISIRRKFIQQIGLVHSSGIACYPDAPKVACVSEDDLSCLGLSKSKAATLMRVSKMVVEEVLPLDKWCIDKPIEEITQTLLNIKGIGQWTVSYTLLRGLGWLDGSLHSDVAVHHKLSLLLNSNNGITEKETSLWLAQFAPWRALVAAHLWAMKK